MTTSARPSWFRRLTVKENIDSIVGTLVSVYCMAVAIGDFAGIWGGLSQKIPALTLLLVSVVSLYLVIERQSSIRETRESIDETHRSVKNLETRFDQGLHGISEQTNMIRAAMNQVDAFFGAAAKQDKFAQLRLAYAARELGKFSSEQIVTLGREYIFPAWLDCLSSAQTFDAFNYVRADEVWRSGYFEEASHIAQVGRLAQGARVRRVFMVDDEEERQYLEPLMQHQANAGIDVRWILAADVQKLPFVDDHFQVLGTKDLIVIDDEMVFRVFLDSGRSMQHCSIARDRHLADIVTRVFSAAYRAATPVAAARKGTRR